VLHDGARAFHRAPRRAGWIGVAICAALAATLALWLWGTPLASSGHVMLQRAESLPALIRVPRVDDSQVGGGTHQYWQVGLTAGPEASNASAMRTTITTVLPQQVAAQTTNYYWIGSYLADGSFIQIGYYVAWYDPTSAGWFYCSFSPTQQKGPCVYGPSGSAGADGTVYSYALESDAQIGSGAGTAVWTALVDGSAVGSFSWTSGTTGTNSPGIYAESSGFTAHAADSTLGPVDFPLPLETRAAGQTSYQTAHHVRPAYDADDICPPYGAASDGSGGVLLGSQVGCPPSDQWLW
jgi:hypothetical protein